MSQPACQAPEGDARGRDGSSPGGRRAAEADVKVGQSRCANSTAWLDPVRCGLEDSLERLETRLGEMARSELTHGQGTSPAGCRVISTRQGGGTRT